MEPQLSGPHLSGFSANRTTEMAALLEYHTVQNFGSKKVGKNPLLKKKLWRIGLHLKLLATTYCTARMQHRYMRLQVINNSLIMRHGSRFDCESLSLTLRNDDSRWKWLPHPLVSKSFNCLHLHVATLHSSGSNCTSVSIVRWFLQCREQCLDFHELL